MTELLTHGKPANRRWVMLVGALLALVITMAFLWSSYQKDRSLFVRFYLKVTQGINIGDAGVLSGVPCSSPCVFGIRAGETQFDQVIPTLEKNGIRSSKCLTEPNISWFLFYCGVGRLNIQVNTHSNIVNGIWFYPNDRISLGEILEKYGEPDYVSLSQTGALEGPTIQIFVYWDSLRMGVVMPTIDGKTYVVDKATRVELIGFSDEELYQDSSEIELNSAYQLWNGYSTYQP